MIGLDDLRLRDDQDKRRILGHGLHSDVLHRAFDADLRLLDGLDEILGALRVGVDGDNLRANGNFSILQSDYGIRLVSVAGGALKVKDELKISFDVNAKKDS